MVVPGDTLSAIAAALAVRGGWPALYAANRRVIGADPGVIRPGTVLAVPGPAATAAGRGGARAAACPRGRGRRRRRLAAGTVPGRCGLPAAGMPSWLKTVLLAAGLLIGAAFVAEPVLAVRRRRAAARAARAAGSGAALAGAAPPGSGQAPGWRPSRGQGPHRAGRL